ncbi:MAG: hypothetical protein ABF723_04015 [Lentilactobacillus hilgardii]|uniref:hypothetical protein n=1 Tax=Lentilactobacillus hilgardii TaxID=1588 RepID=UPI001CC1C782|nr:hypothetical protein [Lentilactobacillus hilgardii]MBZ2200057.1 hypothetical protein [Lentilactobacillus hilgardii]MBZ2203177.1 hypothetical protein [Lentilactobacillus hilgardii]
MRAITKQMEYKLMTAEKVVNEQRLLALFEAVKSIYPAHFIKERSEIVINVPHTDVDISVWSNADMKIHIETGDGKRFLEPTIRVSTIWEAAQVINYWCKKYHDSGVKI